MINILNSTFKLSIAEGVSRAQIEEWFVWPLCLNAELVEVVGVPLIDKDKSEDRQGPIAKMGSYVVRGI